MKLGNFIKGLQIFQQYLNDPNGFHIGAEHDQFYIYATDKPLSNEDVEKLVALGWFQEDVECDDADGFEARYYDQEEGWTCYV